MILLAYSLFRNKNKLKGFDYSVYIFHVDAGSYYPKSYSR